jgi:hypothetical protein
MPATVKVYLLTELACSTSGVIALSANPEVLYQVDLAAFPDHGEATRASTVYSCLHRHPFLVLTHDSEASTGIG